MTASISKFRIRQYVYYIAFDQLTYIAAICEFLYHALSSVWLLKRALVARSNVSSASFKLFNVRLADSLLVNRRLMCIYILSNIINALYVSKIVVTVLIVNLTLFGRENGMQEKKKHNLVI